MLTDATPLQRLARLVCEMRTAQKGYFEHRSQANLSKAKEFERRVDKAVAHILTAQQELFEHGE